MKIPMLAASVLSLATAAFAHAAPHVDPLTQPIPLQPGSNWNAPQQPMRIYGNTYYVGMAGLSAVLIHGDSGSILLDGDLPQSAPEIEAHIRTLGFRIEDVKYILNSHAHFDHAGGIAALQRDSGAEVLASPSGTQALLSGRVAPDDPQAGYADNRFPAVAHARAVHDDESVRLGDIVVTAHFTPGHTPGSTTWTWRSCENGKCLDIVYSDSLNAISAPGFHFLADATHADLTARFRKSIRTVANLPCDILLTVHPELADIGEKLSRLKNAAQTNPFIDPQACRNYAHAAEIGLDARIAQERGAAHVAPRH